MNTITHIDVTGRPSFSYDERTQLDWDIEEARFEMKNMGTDLQCACRNGRHAARKMYMVTLSYSIKRALESK